jgi:hypothetical protein
VADAIEEAFPTKLEPFSAYLCNPPAGDAEVHHDLAKPIENNLGVED